MAAVAAVTRRVRVGSMMICVPFRNPALLAKAVVSIDHISGGRVELAGLGTLTILERVVDEAGRPQRIPAEFRDAAMKNVKRET